MDEIKCRCGNIKQVNLHSSKAWDYIAKVDKESTCCPDPNYHIFYSGRKLRGS